MTYSLKTKCGELLDRVQTQMGVSDPQCGLFVRYREGDLNYLDATDPLVLCGVDRAHASYICLLERDQWPRFPVSYALRHLVRRMEDFQILRAVKAHDTDVTYHVRDKKSGKEYLQRRIEHLQTRDPVTRIHQLQLHAQMRHPLVMPLSGIIIEGDSERDGRASILWTLTEYRRCKPLRKWVYEDQKCQPGRRQQRNVDVMRCVAEALRFFHSRHMIYFNLNWDVVFVTEDEDEDHPVIAVLGDLRLAKSVDVDSAVTYTYTTQDHNGFQDPCLLRGQHVTSAVDVYSFGKLL